MELVLDLSAPLGKSFVTGDAHHQYVHINPYTKNIDEIFEVVKRRLFQAFGERFIDGK